MIFGDAAFAEQAVSELRTACARAGIVFCPVFATSGYGELESRLGGRKGVATEVMDVTAEPDPLGERVFDSILCLNVLEHIRDDEKEHVAELTKLIQKLDATQAAKFKKEGL